MIRRTKEMKKIEKLVFKEKQEVTNHKISLELKNMSNGITLIALIVTIIILLILAGIAMFLLIDENGILSKSKKAVEQYNQMQVKEEMELAIVDIRTELLGNNKQFNMESVIQYLPEKLKVESINLWTNTQLEEPEGQYKNYAFIVTKDYEVIFKENEGWQVQHRSENAMYFKGNTYISTDLSQDTIFSNNPYTIATRIKINSDQQKTIDLMGILGTHNGSSGLALQFQDKTANLMLVVNGSESYVDYTPYYDSWVDIIITCKDDETKMYFNGNLVTSANQRAIYCGDFILGSSVHEKPYNEARAMKGLIYNAIIWNTEFSQSEIQEMDLLNIENTKNENKIFEEYLGSERFLQYIRNGRYEMENQLYEIVDRDYQFVKKFKLLGGTYLDTGISQASIYANNEYTIATKVKINESYGLMGILGTHNGSSGIALQFNSSNTNLSLVINGNENYIDYTQYYNNWVDIVVTFDGTNIKVYFNKELVSTITQTPIACGNFLIGTSLDTTRGMIGNITNTKVWKKALTQAQIQNLNMDEKNTTMEPSSIITQINIEDHKDSLVGTGYGYVVD